VSKRDLVKIEWNDANSPMGGHWQDAEDLDNKPIRCVSVGFVMREDKHAVTLASHLGGKTELHCVNGLMTIPQVCIVKRRKLK